jgi:hypothetical protein
VNVLQIRLEIWFPLRLEINKTPRRVGQGNINASRTARPKTGKTGKLNFLLR